MLVGDAAGKEWHWHSIGDSFDRRLLQAIGQQGATELQQASVVPASELQGGEIVDQGRHRLFLHFVRLFLRCIELFQK